MADVLTIATAGRTREQLDDRAHERYPRVDYIELGRLLDSRLLDYNSYVLTPVGGLLGHLEKALRSDVYLALLALSEQREHASIFAMSERAGIPLAGLRRLLPERKPLVSMFTCWSARQERVTTRLHLFSEMDAIIVHCQSMKRHLSELGACTDQIHVIPYSVDHQFYAPQVQSAADGGHIFTLGEPRSRNYAELFRAIEPLPVELLVAASGRWYSREKDSLGNGPIPANVRIGGPYRWDELRRLYAACRFVVLPIKDLVYSAGATAVLEAMCMAKAVIVTRSRGIADYVKDGETALVVDQGDEAGLRGAIEHLMAHPAEALRLGQNGRQWVEQELNLDRYVQGLAGLLQRTLTSSRKRST